MSRFRAGLFVILAAFLAVALPASRPAWAKEFKWADYRSLSSLEPYFSETFRLGLLANIYEPLTVVDSDGTLQPVLATSWTAVEPTVWRFKLREGVKFHGGESFSADDVVFSINRAMSKTSNMQAGSLGLTKEVRKVDQYTVDFITTAPDPVLPRLVRNLLIMSKGWAEKNNAVEVEDRTGQGIKSTGATHNANGTGPFKLVEWVPGVSLSLAVNPDWWGGPRKDAMTTAKYFEISDAATRLSALLSGQIDLIVNVPPAYANRIKSTSGMKLEVGKGTMNNFLMFDLIHDELQGSNIKGKNPFKDQRVREAIYYAIDVPTIVDKVMKGFAYPSNLPVSNFTVGFDPAFNKRAPADLGRARRLLAEAGYPDGFEVPLECTAGAYTNDEAICLAVSAMLAQIGIKTTISSLPFAAHLTKIQSPVFGGTFFLFGWAASSFDAGSWVSAGLHSRDIAHKVGTFNMSGFSNPEVDQLAKVTETEMDPAKRQQAFSQVWEIMNREYWIAPLLQQATLWAMKDNIASPVNPLNIVSLREVAMK